MAACGATFTAVITDDGELFTCGRGGDGKLGLGDTRGRCEFTRVRFPSPKPQCLAVAAGAYHCAVLAEDGAVWCWGRGSHGQLGIGDSSSFLSPQRLPIAGRVKWPTTQTENSDTGASEQRENTPDVTTFYQASSKVYHAFQSSVIVMDMLKGLSCSVEVFCVDLDRINLDIKNDDLDMLSVACGQRHTVAVVHATSRQDDEGPVHTQQQVQSDGLEKSQTEVWAWGECHGPGHPVTVVPQRIDALRRCNVRMVSCGLAHSVAITAWGELWSWGLGDSGQLGHGDTRQRWSPEPIRSRWFRGHSIIRMVACGYRHTGCVDEGGRLYTWGSNASGALGIGASEEAVSNRLTPVEVEAVQCDVGVAALALGAAHSALITTAGDVYTWGCGTKGQLGHGLWEALTSKGRPLNKAAPELLDVAPLRRCSLQVSCGDAHTGVVTRQGHYYTFGSGSAGRLGLGDGKIFRKFLATPVRVRGQLEKRVVGRCWAISSDRRLAFMMVLHPRLGAASPAEAVPSELLRQILKLTGVDPQAAHGMQLVCHLVGGCVQE